MRKLWSFAGRLAALCGSLFLFGSVSINAQTHPDDTCWVQLGQALNCKDHSGVQVFGDYGGQLVAGGEFLCDEYQYCVLFNEDPFPYPLAVLDGSSWQILGEILIGRTDVQGPVCDYTEFQGRPIIAGDIYDGYYLDSWGGIAAWNGSAWTSVGWDLSSIKWTSVCWKLCVYQDKLIAYGHRGSDLVDEDDDLWVYRGGGFAAWNGATWTYLVYMDQAELGQYWIRDMVVYNDKLIVAGQFTSMGGVACKNIAAWDGATWSALGDGIGHLPEHSQASSSVTSLEVYGGKLIAGGFFSTAGSDTAFNVAAWNDTLWSRLGSGTYGNTVWGYVLDLAVHDGRLIAAGVFDTAGGVAANHIAAWDGERWSALGSGVDSYLPLALFDFHDTLIVGYYFRDTIGNEIRAVTRIVRWKKAKTITIRDAHNDSLPNVQFDLIRVTNNRPNYDEDTLGSFTTDDLGRLAMTEISDTSFTVSLNEGDAVLRIGDYIKIARHLYSEPALRHHAVLGTKYSIHLDNGDFTDDGQFFFDTVKECDQEIILDHTEIRYNLLVSLEWDAAELYVDGLRKDFRYMSDYLYDVSDGQLRLDTIVMLDDGAIWSEADVRIRASNVHNPDAGVGGIHHVGDYPINMPRKWFGDQDDSRYYTYVRHPLMDELSDNYRTIAHELGHYALGFYDEYVCTDGLGNPVNCCTDVMNPPGNFGFMQYQYDRLYNGPFASEMSSDYLYQDVGCRTTDQWRAHDSSCWGLFEFYMEDPIDGIYVPIRKPHLTDSTERRTPGDLNYFPGPNDDPLDLDYDVGRLVRFASPVLPPVANVRSVRVKVAGAPAGGAAVWHEQTATGRMVEQGNTTDDGWIWVLGVDVTQDLVGAAGFGFAVVPPLLAASASLSDRVWLFGSVAPSTDDSVLLELHPVQGSFPMICEGRITESAWEYGLIIERPFSSEPQFDLATESGLVLSTQFESDANGYVTQMPDTAMVTGIATVHALDDASQTFFLITPFAFTDVQAASQLMHLTGPGGSVVASLDSSQSGLHTVLIVSSAYPVPMTGLTLDAVQVSDAHSLSVPPGITLTGSNSIAIYYSESDLAPISGYRVDETDLAVYHWNTGAGQWGLVGGLVDTTLNIVATSITETGVYALFASQIPVDVEDDEHGDILPYRFELSQNYPNPFNPVTTIEYSLPERSHVTIEVYNVLGQKVRTLVDREQSAGSYTITWDGSNAVGSSVSTGVYLYRFQAADHVQTKKMLLQK